jgi:hypothetical protein
MKHTFFCISLAGMLVAGCSKGTSDTGAVRKVTITSLAAGAKTKAGKIVDIYEVTATRNPSIVIVSGGGKLEANKPAPINLDGMPIAIAEEMLDNKVLVLQGPMAFPIKDVTAAEAKAKCVANGTIDLPIDETLKAIPTGLPGMPAGMPGPRR